MLRLSILFAFLARPYRRIAVVKLFAIIKHLVQEPERDRRLSLSLGCWKAGA
jgi:hypothetical protein